MQLSDKLNRLLKKGITNEIRVKALLGMLEKENINIIDLLIARQDVNWSGTCSFDKKLTEKTGFTMNPKINFMFKGDKYRATVSLSTRFLKGKQPFALDCIKCASILDYINQYNWPDSPIMDATIRRIEKYDTKYPTVSGIKLLELLHNSEFEKTKLFEALISRIELISEVVESLICSIPNQLPHPSIEGFADMFLNFGGKISISRSQKPYLLFKILEHYGLDKLQPIMERSYQTWKGFGNLIEILSYWPRKIRLINTESLVERDFETIKIIKKLGGEANIEEINNQARKSGMKLFLHGHISRLQLHGRIIVKKKTPFEENNKELSRLILV